MKTEKQIKMSLELAKQMLGKDEAMDMLIKQNFSNEELGIKPKLPKKWEDLELISGYFINESSYIHQLNPDKILHNTSYTNRNTLPTKELAQAMLALCQLLYLRDIYNDGWQPDWKSGGQRYTIVSRDNMIGCFENNTVSHPIVFKTSKLRDLFFENFKDLLEIAKPLL